VDGVIEINQAKALIGGITGSLTDDPAGFPVTITQSGSYRLTGNLVGPGGVNFIQIALSATNVTIDLNGFEIACDIVCTGGSDGISSGFSGLNAPKVTVLNGTVRNMSGAGISIGSSGHVDRVRAVSNGTGIRVGDYSIVSGSHASGNLSQGIDSFSGGVTLTANTVNDNGGSGISCGTCTVIGNTVTSNDVDGITCAVCTVNSNTVSSNGGDGISVNVSGLVNGNTVRSNGRCGLSFSSGTSTATSGYGANVVSDNNIAGSNRQVFGGTPIGQNVCSNGATCTAGSSFNCP
jgi:parallel beta-helix repeat protein